MFSQIADRLKAGEVETHAAFDRRALPAYLTMGLGALITLSFVALGGYRFADPLMLVPTTWSIAFVASGLTLRRYGHPSVGGACESIGLIYSQSLFILSSLPMITAFSLPLADHLLATADQSLGFDWRAYVMLFRDSWLALKIVSVSYMAFMWESSVVLIALFATKKDARAWQFVCAASIALLITVALYPLAPAYGGFAYYGITPAMYPNLGTHTPWSFAPAIHAMKSGQHVITTSLMVGYVSFPSYHAASAVLFSWAAWQLGKRVRWFFVAVNLAMAAAAMIVGAHYLVDLIGGAIVAIFAIRLTKLRFYQR